MVLPPQPIEVPLHMPQSVAFFHPANYQTSRKVQPYFNTADFHLPQK
jgi:hypothetical protein